MIPKLSKKRLAQLDGKKIYNTITASRKAPRKRNPKRKASEFKRCYGSKARVAWVKSLPCVACGIVGFSDNAHIENGGMGRKANYTKIIPLCHSRAGAHGMLFGTEGIGCHEIFHNLGRRVLEFAGGFDYEQLAAAVERAWQDHLTGESANG